MAINSNKVKTLRKQSKDPFITLFNSVLFVTLIGVTLIFWSPALDAFNYPKQATVLILISSLFILFLPKVVSDIRNISLRSKVFVIILFLFLIWQTVVATYHGFFRPEIMWGVFSRANGYLTTASFLLLSILLYLNISISLVVSVVRAAGLSLVLIVGYGLIQLLGKDPVDWINPYNQVIATFGNPNFSASAYIVLALVSSYFMYGSGVKSVFRILASITVAVAIFLSFKSQSIQGLMSLAAAVQVLIVIRLILSNTSMRLKTIILLPLVPVNMLILGGLLNFGPLRGLIYQYTLSVREHYWRVALRMMRDYPVFGVGQDSYGLYYQQYREVGFVKQYGPSLITNNAHNVFLQSGATTGILSAIFLSVLSFLVVIRFIRNVKKFSGNALDLYIALFVSWVAYTLQSLVSIEQIGIAIWGWLLTGILLGFPESLRPREPLSYLWYRKNFPATLVYFLIALSIVHPCTYFVRHDLDLRRALSQPVQKDNLISSEERGQQIVNAVMPLVTLQDYSNFAIRNLYQLGPASKGVEVAEFSISKNSRSYVSLQLLTAAYKQFGNNEKALETYEKMEKLDPNNYFDLLQKSKLLIELNQFSEARSNLKTVTEIGNQEAVTTAKALLSEIFNK